MCARNELFVTTILANTNLGGPHITHSVEESLEISRQQLQAYAARVSRPTEATTTTGLCCQAHPYALGIGPSRRQQLQAYAARVYRPIEATTTTSLCCQGL